MQAERVRCGAVRVYGRGQRFEDDGPGDTVDIRDAGDAVVEELPCGRQGRGGREQRDFVVVGAVIGSAQSLPRNCPQSRLGDE